MPTETKDNSRYLSRKQGAAYLNISERLFDNWVAQGRFRVVRAGRRVLADVADLDKFYATLKQSV